MPTAAPGPMGTALKYVQKTRAKRDLDRQVAAIKQELSELEPQILELIEAGQLPESFKMDGASVYTREQVWASPLEGDHAALTTVLRELGLVEYLPSKVNSQSISAYVREHVDPETGEIDLDPRLLAALNISTKINAVVNG